MKKYFVVFLFSYLCFFFFPKVKAQEFRCQVSVSAQQVQSTDKRVFETMKAALENFINNRKWTNYTFKPEEKIDCSIGLIISEQTSRTTFKAQLNIQSRRPVYNSNYTTTMFNYMEPEFVFTYDETVPIEFSSNTYYTNLSSTIAFYLYILLGLDFDSYSQYGGTTFFTMAQTIVQTADKSDSKGWKSFEGSKNKYWLIENYTNPLYKGLREANYQYHRLGLDMMSVNQTKARASIIEALKLVQAVTKEKQNLFAVQLFGDAKISEIISIFTPASEPEKTDVLEAIRLISPINVNKVKSAFNP